MKKLVAAFAITALTALAHADIVQVSAPGNLGPGPFAVETFEGALNPAVTFSAASGVRLAAAAGFASGGTPSGAMGLSTFGFPDPITLTFAAPASSVGLYFGNDDTCCSTGFTAFMDIFDASGLIGTIGVKANMNDFADQFLGFTSDAQVTSVTVRFGSGDEVGLYTYIDDVYFNTARQEVPEPGSLALVGLALASAAAARRRRTQR